MTLGEALVVASATMQGKTSPKVPIIFDTDIGNSVVGLILLAPLFWLRRMQI